MLYLLSWRSSGYISSISISRSPMVLPVSRNSSSQGWGLVGEEKAPLPYTGDTKPNGAPNVPQPIPLKKLAAFPSSPASLHTCGRFCGECCLGNATSTILCSPGKLGTPSGLYVEIWWWEWKIWMMNDDERYEKWNQWYVDRNDMTSKWISFKYSSTIHACLVTRCLDVNGNRVVNRVSFHITAGENHCRSSMIFGNTCGVKCHVDSVSV